MGFELLMNVLQLNNFINLKVETVEGQDLHFTITKEHAKELANLLYKLTEE